MSEKMTYEKSMTELESIVKKLSDGKLSMEEGLDLYGKGIDLAKKAIVSLDEFKGKIEILNKDFSEFQIGVEDDDD